MLASCKPVRAIEPPVRGRLHPRQGQGQRLAWAVACCVAAVGLGAGVARAETCQLRIDGPPPSVQVDYDPFVPATAPSKMTFRMMNPGAEACAIDLALTERPGEPTVQPVVADTGLMLELRPAGLLRRTPVPGVFAVTVPAGETVEASLDVVVMTDAVVQAGQYAQELTLELRPAGSAVAYDQAPVVLTLIALPRAQMNLSGARGDFGTGASVSVVDFGRAETGKVRQVFVQTRANNAARLTFTSANRGRLMLVGENPDQAALDYTVALEDQVLDLSQVATRDIDPPRTYAGQAFELLLTLGKVEGARAGDYSDELTIEISTL